MLRADRSALPEAPELGRISERLPPVVRRAPAVAVGQAPRRRRPAAAAAAAVAADPRRGGWCVPPARPLRVELRREDRDYFLEPSPTPEFTRVGIAVDGATVRYLSYRVAAWIDIENARGTALLTHGSWEPTERSIEQYADTVVDLVVHGLLRTPRRTGARR